MNEHKLSSKGPYGYFVNNGGVIAEAYNTMYETTKSASALDKKTHELAYIAYLSAIQSYTGLEKHVKGLRTLGATREEVESAILCGMAPLGITQTQAYKIAMNAFDE
jgi:alkylhydroperoxidase/carboxymuconolactone decarboxylase family protein YurZ